MAPSRDSDEHLQTLLDVGRAASVGITFQERMAGVVPLVQRLIPRAHAVASVLDPDAPGRLVEDPAWCFGGDVGAVSLYAERFMSLDPLRPVYVEASGRPALLSDTETGRRFGQDPFTREFLGGLGIRHVMLSAHRMSDGAVFAFALHRGPEQPDFDARERTLLALCAPDLGRAALGPVLRRVLLQHVSGGAPSVHALAFDAQKRVVHGDLGASLLLDAATFARLSAAVEAFLDDRPARGTTVHMRVPSSGGALPARLVALDGRSGLAALAILSHEVADSRFEQLVREARLTARERQVAALAIEGLRNRDIAERLGVGVDTVKWHLKTIFQKTKVRGRGGLAAIVLGRA